MALLQAADAALAAQDPNRALQATKDAMQIYRAAGDEAGMAEVMKYEAGALNMQTNMHVAREEYEKALAAAGRARSLYLAMGDMQEALHTSHVASQLHVFVLAKKSQKKAPDFGQAWKDAVKAARECVALAQRLQNQDIEAKALILIAQMNQWNGSFADAIQTAQEAQMLSRKRGDASGEASALLSIAGAHLEAGDADKAKSAADEGMNHARRSGDAEMMEEAADMQSRISGGPSTRVAASFGGGGAGERQVTTAEVTRVINLLPFGLNDGMDDNPLMMSGVTKISAPRIQRSAQK
eukprot:gnl/TRDRNA2_/TRDRNA2_81922_c0_seq1.p1 gnl/TRDRNA2_/TRDRNA2_81922_c0~~gnl/TRDRNA2_/TRDRNA2_81922_c0_seq1.p1  ORF type:complete len:321 (+),score=80.39 gnl/TRDRNA2_/TRDRNA2_81922_c0_seq1:76-963(+)